MAKKADKNQNKKSKKMGPTLIVLMTMLFVSNGVWAFVMYDFNQEKILQDHFIKNQQKVREIKEELLTYLSYKNCIDKRDIWKVFAMKGVVRNSNIHWTLDPYEFHFSGRGCLLMDREIEEDEGQIEPSPQTAYNDSAEKAEKH